MKVIAAAGLQVPKEGAPREYITDQAGVDVALSTYYLRQVACGDLIEIKDETPQTEPTETSTKVADKPAAKKVS